MPIPPPPITFRCPGCGWKKTTAPRSDERVIGVDWFDCCPKCGRKDILCEIVRPPVGGMARVKQLLGL